MVTVVLGVLVALTFGLAAGFAIGRRWRRVVAAAEPPSAPGVVSILAEPEAESMLRDEPDAPTPSEEPSSARYSRAVGPLVEEILDSCDGAAASSSEAGQVSDDIARSVERLANAVEETMRAMMDIRTQADVATHQTVGRIGDVRSDVLDGSTEVRELADAIAEMSAFVSVIKDIADQTNLLSLNARIEAARAGDAGRGFAVVAEEVRKLAESSSAEADTVRQAIGKVEAAAQRAVDRIAASSSRLGEVADDLDRLGSAASRSWDDAQAEVETIRSRARDVAVANRQGVAASERIREDVGVITRIAERLGSVDSLAADALADDPPSEPLLEQVRRTGKLRVGVERGVPGLNFDHPKTGKIMGVEVELLELVGRELGVRIEMVDRAWVDLPKKLRRREFDVIFNGIIPSPDYRGLRYTRAYLDQGLVVMRKLGNTEISTPSTLNGKTIAIVADPAARQSLDDCGIRPGELRQMYDLSDVFGPVVDGVYDASVIDLPVVYWSTVDVASPWRGQVEIVGDPITKWIFCAATRDEGASEGLRLELDAAIGRVRQLPEFREIVQRYLGRVYDWRLTAADFLSR